MRVVDHELDEPVYLQLANILREMIETGEIQPRRALPSIRTLVQEQGVADQTVKKAIDVLRNEGLVRTVPGRGVFVVGK